ncbi:MAG: nitrilase family protein [Bacteroidales bacterium]
MQDIKIAIIQTELLWEDIPGNLSQFDQKISSIKETVDLIILPEMFNTAFSMNPAVCAEIPGGTSLQWMKKKAKEKSCVIAGSLLTNESNKYYNRLIWMMQDGNYKYYDKKHLFRFAGEHKVFSSGNRKITAPVKGWNIRPLICYDLRFPVWSMNTFENLPTGQAGGKFEYDCLVYIANWPEKRRDAWMSLLIARAIENQSYVIGVNRIGTDGKGNSYTGDSMIIAPAGNILLQIPANKECTEIFTLSYSEIQSYREHFRIAPDWDKFTILE